jgi:hypothetical protein
MSIFATSTQPGGAFSLASDTHWFYGQVGLCPLTPLLLACGKKSSTPSDFARQKKKNYRTFTWLSSFNNNQGFLKKVYIKKVD